MSDWYTWIQNIALDRIDEIERHLNTNPGLFPRFTEAAQRIDAAMEQTPAHPNDDLTERDDLWTAYSSALALEMYLAGADPPSASSSVPCSLPFSRRCWVAVV